MNSEINGGFFPDGMNTIEGMAPLNDNGPEGEHEMPLADISHLKKYKLDLKYGENYPQETFDIYYPENEEGPFPVLLHIHGGGFALGDKRDFHTQELFDALNHGYALASCNYRRSGDEKFPAAVIDCRKFVDYLHKHADELNIDDSKICAFGGSAGGNLSAILAMNLDDFYGETEKVDASVACAVDWFGPTNFKLMDDQARKNGVSIADHDMPLSPESKYLGGPVQEMPQQIVDLANPITYINNKMAPLLMQHGNMDTLVPFEQSVIFKDTIEEKLGTERIVWLPIPGAGHDDPLFKCDQNFSIVWAFLDKYLKGIEPEMPIENMKVPELNPNISRMTPFGIQNIKMNNKKKEGLPKGPKTPQLDQKILDSIKEKYLDIQYCNISPEQRLDLYLPLPPFERSKPFPVIIHFHGGAFMMCTKRDDSVAPMLEGLKRGYAVVSAEYRKSGEAIFPAMVLDAKAVVRWVKANAEKYNLDSNRIATWGPSSGGWLASMVALTEKNSELENLSMGNAQYTSNVQACIDWCGPCAGFLKMDEMFKKNGAGIPDHNEADSPESLFLGRKITDVPDLVEKSNPMTYVTKGAPKFLIIHGGADAVVPVEQSIEFAAKINEVCGEGRATLYVAEGKAHHGHPWYHEKWVSNMCLDFLDEVLK